MTDQPAVFNPENLEILDFLVADPKCTRGDCHGRGYTGVKPDGTPIFCRCARLVETDKIRIKNELKALDDKVEMLGEKTDNLLDSQNNGFKILAASLGELHERTVLERLKRAGRWVMRRETK